MSVEHLSVAQKEKSKVRAGFGHSWNRGTTGVIWTQSFSSVTVLPMSVLRLTCLTRFAM